MNRGVNTKMKKEYQEKPKRERPKVYCNVKGCTKQVWRKGMCKAHIKAGAQPEICTLKKATGIQVTDSEIIKNMSLGNIKNIVKIETACKCKSPMKLLSDECVIRLYQGEGGYGAIKVYHRDSLLYSAIGLIERVKTEKEN
jgi:hypothetical protein